MKTLFTYTVSAIAGLFLFFFCAMLAGCGPKEHSDPYAAVKVNPAFARNPPIATNVTITRLDSCSMGNLLYEATMPKEQIKSDVLAVLVNDTDKIVLHDDGKNGDKVAGDGIYSTVMNVSTDSLNQYLSAQATSAKRFLGGSQRVFEFKGRMEFPVSTTELNVLQNFTIADKGTIDIRRATSLIPILHLPLLTPVSASFKHTSLIVTDPTVVNDPSRTFNPCTHSGTPGGAWTFGKLMTDLAHSSGITPENFVLNWMNTWNSDQTVNGDVIPKRQTISTLINTWQTLCGGPSAPLDVNKAPFKLTAIVNRFDLRSGGAYGGGNAGEGRFVFCALDANCNPQPFFVIFEFGVNKTTCASIHAYAQQWVNLSGIPFPSATYNTALQAITDQFATAGTNPAKPNGSSLDQLRTNEILLGLPLGLNWELREFNISAQTHGLFNVTTKREPQIPFNSQGSAPNAGDVIAFGGFVNQNAAQIIADNMDLPATLPVGTNNVPFIAGHAITLNATTYHWDAVVVPGAGHIINDTARMHISLNACSGCHGGETISQIFTQVHAPASITQEATLSRFLTGNPAFSSSPFLVPDPAGRPTPSAPISWPFNDLERRGRDLLFFVSQTCTPPFHFPIIAGDRIPLFVPIELTNQLTFRPNTMSD